MLKYPKVLHKPYTYNATDMQPPGAQQCVEENVVKKRRPTPSFMRRTVRSLTVMQSRWDFISHPKESQVGKCIEPNVSLWEGYRLKLIQ